MSTSPRSPEDAILSAKIEQIVKRERRRKRNSLLVCFAVVGGAGWWCYTALDDIGWIPHTHAVDMYMEGDWLEGENRVCSGVQTIATPDKPREVDSLACPENVSNASPHNISVTFWGKISRPDATTKEEFAGTKFAWRCTRRSDGFNCKAIN